MSKGKPIFVGAMVVSWTAIGCAVPNRVVYSAVNQPPRPFQRKAAESVDVFIGKPPDRPHLDAGVFEIYQGKYDDASGRSTEDMIGTLRVHSALRGCDAVQILGIEIVGSRAVRVVHAVCEVYTDDHALHAVSTPGQVPPLPGENSPCTSASGESIAITCTDPLVCENQRCVSPYR